jgi:hypothetical protein
MRGVRGVTHAFALFCPFFSCLSPLKVFRSFSCLHFPAFSLGLAFMNFRQKDGGRKMKKKELPVLPVRHSSPL